MFTPREAQSRAIEVLRFPLAVLVVCIHSYYFNQQHINAIGTGVGASIVQHTIDLISIVLTDCAVPMFFVISGYLYFLKNQNPTFCQYLKKTKGKIPTLVVPYLVWNLVAIIFYPGNFFHATWLEKILGFWSRNLAWGNFTGPWDGPLWFIRDLFVVMLLAPVICKIIRKTSLLLPLLLTAIFFCYPKHNLCPGISLVSFLFFSIGAWLAIKRPDFSSWFSRKKFIFLLPIFATFFLLRYSAFFHSLGSLDRIFNEIWIFVSMAAYFALALRIGQRTRRFDTWRKLGASSFVIFAFHSLLLGRISSTFLWLIGKPNMDNT